MDTLAHTGQSQAQGERLAGCCHSKADKQ